MRVPQRRRPFHLERGLHGVECEDSCRSGWRLRQRSGGGGGGGRERCGARGFAFPLGFFILLSRVASGAVGFGRGTAMACVVVGAFGHDGIR